MENSSFWHFLDKSKTGRIVFNISIIILSLILFWAFGRHIYKDMKGQHSKLFGWEVNNQKTVIEYKTDTLRIYDTIRIPALPQANRVQTKPKETAQVKNDQKIESGGSGIQNNAPNHGVQIGGDVTGDVNVNQDPMLGRADLSRLIYMIDSIRNKNGFVKKHVSLDIIPQSNGQKIFSQIEHFLKEKGYQLSVGQSFGSTFNGIEVGLGDVEDEDVMVTVGLF